MAVYCRTRGAGWRGRCWLEPGSLPTPPKVAFGLPITADHRASSGSGTAYFKGIVIVLRRRP
jgi:hypothetical protein